MGQGFRVIYNQDCTNLFHVLREPITPEHVDHMVEEVADAGVEVLLLNGNAQRTCHPSRAWQTFWEGYVPGDEGFFGPVPPEEVPGRAHWVEQMQRLAAGGCDYLARGLGRCRERGLVPGVSVRMNDVHDYPQRPDSHLFSSFYREHPDYRLENAPELGWGSGGLNYAVPEVRAHYLAYVQELVATYEFGVLDLDFLRFEQYFPQGRGRELTEVMTDFVRKVRGLLADSGREISLLARVAATPEAGLALGFDVGRWAEEGLVDGVSFAAFLLTDWGMPVEEWRALVGDDVGLYASADYTAERGDERWPTRRLPLEDSLLRGFAAGHRAAGADGIYLFNFFCAREEEPPLEPHFGALKSLGESGLARTYLVTTGVSSALTDLPSALPVRLDRGESGSFSLLVGAPEEGEVVRVVVVWEGRATGWQLRLKGSVPPGQQPDSERELAEGLYEAVWSLPAETISAGRNEVELLPQGAEAIVLRLEVEVAPQP